MFLIFSELASEQVATTHSPPVTAPMLQSTEPPDDHVYCIDGKPQGVMPSIRIVVGITCVLSMIGAFLIILSYFLVRDIRTKAREVLVNLSLMDFMAAAANLAGVLGNFNYYLGPDHPTNETNYNHIHNLCLAQATFAMYGTISSVLWTICLAVYVFLRIMLEGNGDIAKNSVKFLYTICYGIPLGLTLWFVFTKRLGYAPYGGSGWCSLILSDHKNSRNIFAAVFGNDLWIYLTIILVPLIFLTLHFYLRNKIKSGRAILTKNLSSSVQSMEMKLLAIPIFFILLRIWSLLFVIFEVEAGIKLKCSAVLFFLHIGGIGDSGQGFANAILFVVFTPKVRQFYITCFLQCFRCCQSRYQFSNIGYSTNTHDPSKPYYGSMQSSDAADHKEGSSSHVFSRSGSHSSGSERKNLLLNTAP